MEQMEQLCKNCKHWTPPPTDKYEMTPVDDDYGKCSHAMQKWDATKDSNEDDYAQVYVEGKVPGILCCDGSQYHASIVTLPTFGCNEWEKP